VPPGRPRPASGLQLLVRAAEASWLAGNVHSAAEAEPAAATVQAASDESA
jgi:hypothetical protein